MSGKTVKICVIDDTDEGIEILKAAFAGADNIEISGRFSENTDITVYLSSRDCVLKNIRPDSSIIFSSNRYIKTDVAVRAVICGLYEKSTVTASSVIFSGDGMEFVYCLQRSVMTLDNTYAEIGEIKVKSEWNCLEKALAAVTARIIVYGGGEDFIELKKNFTDKGEIMQ